MPIEKFLRGIPSSLHVFTSKLKKEKPRPFCITSIQYLINKSKTLSWGFLKSLIALKTLNSLVLVAKVIQFVILALVF